MVTVDINSIQINNCRYHAVAVAYVYSFPFILNLCWSFMLMTALLFFFSISYYGSCSIMFIPTIDQLHFGIQFLKRLDITWDSPKMRHDKHLHVFMLHLLVAL